MIELEGAFLNTANTAHPYLKERLGFPEYYGENLDALADCLSDMIPLELIVKGFPATSYGKQILQVMKEAGVILHTM